jgi:hypothetical protein
VTEINPGVPDDLEIPDSLWRAAADFANHDLRRHAQQLILSKIADAQLHRCVQWLCWDHGLSVAAQEMQAAMRPEPPTLKSRALSRLKELQASCKSAPGRSYLIEGSDLELAIQAIESIPDPSDR